MLVLDKPLHTINSIPLQNLYCLDNETYFPSVLPPTRFHAWFEIALIFVSRRLVLLFCFEYIVFRNSLP